MKQRKTFGSRAFDACNVAFMLLLMAAMLYPFLHVLALSLSENDQIMAGLVTFFPRGFNIRGYQHVFQYRELARAYINTILYAFVGTFLTLSLTSLIAYPLSRRDFMLRKPLTIYLAITMFFGGGLIPTYLLISKLKLLNTFTIMVLPGAVGAYNVIVFRSFFSQLPQELWESAYIDGANDVLILFRIILPLSKALLATFGLFAVVGHWNSWFNALIYLRDDYRMPLQILLRRMLIEDTDLNMGTESMLEGGALHPKNVQMAITVVTMVPILAVYPFAQRYFVKGVLIGTIKG